MTLYEMLNSNISLLISGFILTTVFGSFFVWILQFISWKKQVKIDIYKKQYDDGIVFLENLSVLIGKRYYLTHKRYNELDNKIIEEEYQSVLKEWNYNLRLYRAKLRLLFGNEIADRLYLVERDNLEEPKSLHYKFQKTNEYIKRYARKEIMLKEMDEVFNDLASYCSEFIDLTTNEFMILSKGLKLVDMKRNLTNAST